MATMCQGAENVIGYTFNDRDIFWEALQAAGSGVTRIGGRPILAGNKRLAMLGDAIAQVVLLEEWYASVETQGK